MASVGAPLLGTVPQEVLEHIAIFAATDEFLGPPSAIVPFLCTNRRIHSCLSMTANPALYAQIFHSKFDVKAVTRRLGPKSTTSASLCAELKQRCSCLKRMRLRLDSIANPATVDENEELLRPLLWTAYLMMLENDGKNGRQLKEYGRIGPWIREFWFDQQGASLASVTVRQERWPPANEFNTLAMWLMWFLLDPDEYIRNDYVIRTGMNLLKLMSLGAHKYSICEPSWVDFVPKKTNEESKGVTHYGEIRRLIVPPLAAPAILAFLALANKAPDMSEGFGYAAPFSPIIPLSESAASREWDCEWARCRVLGESLFDQVPSGAFEPGSIDGVWEGVFTYTEFTAYASLLAGAIPQVLHRSLVAQHRQTWKLREHHLVARSSSDHVLPAGDPLKAYLPFGAQLEETSDGVIVREQGRSDVIRYQRAPITANMNGADDSDDLNDSGQYKAKVVDIIITGEGHSAWGQFNLVGRIRPCDGFINILKQYMDDDRGTWIYRGYLVGNANGNVSGMWRDTISPADVAGYEGCFMMSRRR